MQTNKKRKIQIDGPLWKKRTLLWWGFCVTFEGVYSSYVRRMCLCSDCDTRRHTATHRDTLQHIATQCNTPQHTATHCYTLQHTATHCNTLQLTATHCNTLQRTATHQHLKESSQYLCNTCACAPTIAFDKSSTESGETGSLPLSCSLLQCVAVCCSVLQCFTGGCSVLRLYSGLQCVVASQNGEADSSPLSCWPLSGKKSHSALGSFKSHHCSTLQHSAIHCNVLQHTATHCNTLQYTDRFVALIWQVLWSTSVKRSFEAQVPQEPLITWLVLHEAPGLGSSFRKHLC